MKCPFCNDHDSRVIDSRIGRDGVTIRRRRTCQACGRRFSTREIVEEILPTVVKKDGVREPFLREKVITGLIRSCQKRPVSTVQMEELVDGLERALFEMGEKEVDSRAIGEMVLTRLRALDHVAYVRFASVYREFSSVEQFKQELDVLMQPE